MSITLPPDPLEDSPLMWTSPQLVEASKKLSALEILASRLSALPDRSKDGDVLKGGYKIKAWTEVEDLALLDYWPVKVQRDVARVLKRSIRSCIDRYEYLKSLEQDGKCP